MDRKAVLTEFFDAANRDGMAVLRDFATSDMIFSAPGIGDLTVDQYIGMVESLGDILETPISLKVRDILVDGDSVAAEVESHAVLKNGKIYNNKYHFKISMRSGKISRMVEYHDTKHAFDTFDLGNK